MDATLQGRIGRRGRGDEVLTLKWPFDPTSSCERSKQLHVRTDPQQCSHALTYVYTLGMQRLRKPHAEVIQYARGYLWWVLHAVLHNIMTALGKQSRAIKE